MRKEIHQIQEMGAITRVKTQVKETASRMKTQETLIIRGMVVTIQVQIDLYLISLALMRHQECK